jgi:hypothetical protein
MGGGGTVLVPACMGFRGAFRASSAYSFIGLYFGVGRVLLKAERERAWVGRVWARLSVKRARDVHCDRILLCVVKGGCAGKETYFEPIRT